MQTLSIDIETYSSNNLLTGGVYKYTQAPDFEILLFAYSIDGRPVQIVDLASGEKLPQQIKKAITDKNILKTAFNAQFERLCLSAFLDTQLTADQWECTMVKGAMLGLPFSLAQVGSVLKLNTQKDAAGKALIKYFSVPCKPTKVNGGRTRNLPQHDPEKWQAFKDYCIKDVEVENQIREKINWFNIPESEKKMYQLDQKINDTGIRLDMDLVRSVVQINDSYMDQLSKRAVEITDLDNPNSAAQLKNWIGEKTGIHVDSLNKSVLPDLEEKVSDPDVLEMLEIRKQLSKTSIKKYSAMEACVCSDSRAHGLVQYYGANRTGRWSGRLIQIQNLPRIYEENIEMARDLALSKDGDWLGTMFGNVPDTLSQLIRTAFVASPGNRLIVVDFSAIELIVIAWLAGEKWVMDEYTGKRKIYEMTAARMLNVPVETITKESPERQKGKIASLACQYQGGPGALISMGALRMGLDEDELPGIIVKWRNANEHIVGFWYKMQDAAYEAVENPGVEVKVQHGISFQVKRNCLFMKLPSGRSLSYINPDFRPNRFGSTGLSYQGLNQTTKKWERTETYGGKLAENATQAVARDLLAEALIRLDKARYPIVSHVHDEAILDVPKEKGSLEEVIEIMTETPKWAKGLPIAAEGFESEFYKK